MFVLTPVTVILERLKQDDCEVKTRLVYKARPCLNNKNRIHLYFIL